MAIALVGTPIEKVQSGGTTCPMASYIATAGNLLLALILQYDSGGPTINTPTAASHTFVAATAQRTEGGATGIRIYYEANCPGGAVVVTFNSGSGTSDYYGVVAEFSGMATTSPLDQITASGGAGTDGTADATSGVTTQADELVIGLMAHPAGGTLTVTGGATQIQEDEGFSGSSSYLIVSSTGAKVVSWTNPASSWVCDVATFKAAAAAGGAGPLVGGRLLHGGPLTRGLAA